MSGIEAAGLVLAVLPLFISAAEHYKEGIRFVKRAVKKELFATQYKEELTQQKTLLVLYIKGVVGRTELSPEIQLKLVSDPFGGTWSKSNVIKHVSGELAEAYQPFMDILARICKVFTKQIKEDATETLDTNEIIQQLQNLCLEHDKIASSGKSKDKLFDRIKFSWKSSQRAEILDELQSCTKMIDKLSLAAERAKPFVKKQQSRRVHAAYEHREIMQKLFEILQNACKCTPIEARQVGLRLQVRTDETEDDLDSTFQMILFLSKGVLCELSAKIAKATSEKPAKKKVKIITSSSVSAISGLDPRGKNLKVLGDICKEVSHAHACRSCLQIVVDKHAKVYCSAQAPQTRIQTAPQQVLSLTDVMTELRLYDQKRWLHREKSILGLILAYSLLQIHDSSWFQEQWSSNNITFIDDGQISKPRCNNIQHLRRPYTRSQVATSAICADSMSSSKPPRRNAHLHALGVVLVELYLNRSIQKDVEESGTNDYRSTAQDLLEDHADDMTMTPEYLQAVRFCLSPKPNPCSGSFSFEDKGFRETYYTEVLAMLEENLTHRFEVDESVWLEGS